MFSNKIRTIRNVLELSQKELSKEIDIPERTIASYELGRAPSILFLLKICQKYNINANWFVTGNGEMFNNSSSTIGSRIDDIKNKNNLSNKQFAEILNITENELKDIIENKIKPNIDILKNLKNNFNISIDWLIM